MKKLMIALSAAALAIGAYAEGEALPVVENFNDSTDIPATISGAGESSISTAEYSFSKRTTIGAPTDAGGDDEVPGNNLAVKTPLASPAYWQPGAAVEMEGVYFDSLVKFTYCDEDATVPADDAKLMVWVKENPDDATDVRLMVTGGKVDPVAESVVQKIYDCGPLSGYGVTGADDWCRLTIKARAGIDNDGVYQGFVVFVNGTPVTLASSGDNRDIGLALDQLNKWDREWAKSDHLIPSIQAQATTLTAVGFAGQGAVDDLVVTKNVPTAVDEKIGAFAADLDPVVATVNGTECKDLAAINAAIAAATEAAAVILFDDVEGDLEFMNEKVNTLDLNGKTLDGGVAIDTAAEEGAQSTSLTISGKGMVNGKLDCGRCDAIKIAGGQYLASAQMDGDVSMFLDNAQPADPENYELKQVGSYWELVEVLENGTEAKPWKLASEADLMDKLVGKLADLDAAHQNYVMTGDIELTEAFDGIGARDMKDTLSSSLETYTSANVFKGVFDGQGHTISGVILKTGDYIGFFNSTYGATIKDLKLSLGNETGWSDATANQVGAVFVGVSVDTAIENCQTVADGTFDTFRASKTAAGLVGFAAHGTVIKDCVNNLNIVSDTNDKAGGIVACAQAGKSTGNGIVIDGCSSYGDVTNGGTSPFVGGIGYADIKVTLKGDNVIQGVITAKPGDPQSLMYIAGSGSVVVDDDATITVPANYKTANKAVDGLNYATVEDGVATLVANAVVDGCTEKGAKFKVMTAGNKPQTHLWTRADEDLMYIYLDETLAGIDRPNSFVVDKGYHAESVADLDTYHCYGAVIDTYTITYMNGDAPIELSPAQYSVDKEVTLPTELGIVGVQLVGWYDNAEFTGEPVTTIAKGETGDKTFYAKTEVVVPKVPVTVPAGLPGGEYVVTIDGEKADPAEFVAGGAMYLLPVGSSVEITAEPNEGYKVVGTNPYVIEEVTKDTTVDTNDLPKFVKLISVTVPAGLEGGAYVVTIDDEKADPVDYVAGGAVYQLPVGSRVEINAEPVEGYKVVGDPYVIEEVKEDTVIDTEALPKFEKEGGYPDEWPVTDPETKAKFADWRAGAGADADLSQPEAKEAFLLNCAVDDVDTEAAAFKITSLAQDAEGKWVATPTEKNTAGNAYNGKVTVKSYSDVGCKTEADNGNFFRAILDFPAPAAE